jgi:hypothetical protein
LRGKSIIAKIKDTFQNHSGWGWENLSPREDFLRHIVDGVLRLEVDMEVDVGVEYVWYPQELVREDFLVSLHESGLGADCCFNVKGRQFRAHSMVLRQRCEVLYAMIDGSDETIAIKGTSCEAFEVLLAYLYTVKEPQFTRDDIAEAKLVLDLADRFELPG